MKTTHLLLGLLLFCTLSLSAQTETEATKISKDSTSNSFNKWTIELQIGDAKGIGPYNTKYFSSNFSNYKPNLDVNSYSIGARHMFNQKFGVKLALNSEFLRPVPNNSSKEFLMQQYGFSAEGVINVFQLVNLQDYFGRFGLLLHSGIKFDHMVSKTPNIVGDDQNFDEFANNLGIVYGITPQFKINNKLAIKFDFYIQNNYHQKLNYDGSSVSRNDNLTGQLINGSLGLNYTIGKGNSHADWLKNTK
jgi:OOP family OmpA-OmpF porin